MEDEYDEAKMLEDFDGAKLSRRSIRELLYSKIFERASALKLARTKPAKDQAPAVEK